MDDIQKSGSRLGGYNGKFMIPAQWTTEGFMIRFDQLINEHSSYFETYSAVELEHRALFGTNRYKNYEAFRQVRRSFIKKCIKYTPNNK